MFRSILGLVWEVTDRFYRHDADELPIFGGNPANYELYLQTLAREIRREGLMEHLGAGQLRKCGEAERDAVSRAFGKLHRETIIDAGERQDFLSQQVGDVLNTHGWTAVPASIRLDEKTRSDEYYDQAIALGLKINPSGRTRFSGVTKIAKEMGIDRQLLTHHLNKAHEKREEERRAGSAINPLMR